MSRQPINKEAKYELALKQIEKHNLFFIEDVVAFIGISKESFYKYFGTDTEEYKTITDMLEVNKIRTKSSIRAKLYKGSKAAELIALYKLIASNDERKALSLQYIDHSTKGEKMNTSIDLSKLPTEVLRQIAEAQKKD